MNKKEVAELKRLFHPDRTPITRVCGCYVDAEKNKKTKLKEAFLSLPEEEMFKYFDIFKKRSPAQSAGICWIWNFRWSRKQAEARRNI